MFGIQRPFRSSTMLVDWCEVGPFMTNAYVVGCLETKKGAVIDAAARPEILEQMIDEHQLDIVALLQTHAHIDHLGALATLHKKLGAPIYLHSEEMPVYQSAPQQGMMFGLEITPPPPPEHEVHEGETIAIGNLHFEVIHTPGHTPGGVCYRLRDEAIFVGDTLFAGSIGRTDLPGGDYNAIEASLQRLTELPPQLVVFSGHGPPTTIANEIKRNPFLR